MAADREQEALKARDYIERQLSALRSLHGDMLRDAAASERQPGMAQHLFALRRELAALARRISALEAELDAVAPPPDTERVYAPGAQGLPDDAASDTRTFDRYG